MKNPTEMTSKKPKNKIPKEAYCISDNQMKPILPEDHDRIPEALYSIGEPVATFYDDSRRIPFFLGTVVDQQLRCSIHRRPDNRFYWHYKVSFIGRDGNMDLRAFGEETMAWITEDDDE